MSKSLEAGGREGFTHGLTDLNPNNRPVNQCTNSCSYPIRNHVRYHFHLVNYTPYKNQINYSMTAI